jgi:hypothetical protein
VSPSEVMGRFNGYIKNVILQISEARDLGEVNRYSFFEHMKRYTAAPPDTILCDEKFVNAHPVPNVCGVVYTTNNRTDALYLPANDRRHYVTWSILTSADFAPDYFTAMHHWYDREGGNEHVAAYLACYDLSTFNPKAPPLKTLAFRTLVNANRTPEDAELEDTLDDLGRPDAVTIRQIARQADTSAPPFERLLGGGMTTLGKWLGDRRNARQIPHRMESAGYVAVDKPGTKDGIWRVDTRRAVVYVKKELTLAEQIAAAEALVAGAQEGKSHESHDPRQSESSDEE